MLSLLSITNVWADDVTYTFTSKSWAATSGGVAANWTSGKDGAGFSNNGVQVTTAATGANATSPTSFDNISKIVVTYNTNKSKGAGSLGIKIGSNDEVSKNWAYSGSADGTSAKFTLQYDYDTPQSGNVKITANTTTNSIYVVSIAITYTPGGGDIIVKTLKSIAVTGMTTSFDQNDAFSFDGTCTATYSVTKNGEPQADEDKAVTPTSVSSPDMTTIGEKEVTVSFTDGDVTKETSYNISVATAATEVNRVEDIIDGCAYYLKGVRPAGTEYLKFTDAEGTSVAGSGDANKANAIAITFTKVNDGVYQLTTPEGYYLTPAASNGKLVLSSDASSCNVTNQTKNEIDYIRISQNISNTEWSIQKNTSSANFGGYKNTQNDITLIQVGSCVAKQLSSIAVKTNPTKTSYMIGETFDAAGLVITATYDDPSTEDVAYTGNEDKFSFSGFNSASAAASQEITVTYGGKTTTFNVEILDVTLQSVTVSGTPTTLSYTAGDTFDPAGLIVTGHYSDNTDAEITSGITWSYPDANSLLAYEQTSIRVVATVDEVASDAYTVSGLTVAAAPLVASWVASEQGYSDQTDMTTQTIAFGPSSNFSLVFAKGTNSNAPKYYNSGTAVRAYGGNTFALSSTDYKFTQIEIAFSSGEGSNTISTNVGTYEDGTWTGNSKEVTFTIGGTTGHRRIASVMVTYEEALPSVATPTFSVEAGSYFEAQNVTITTTTEGATIYYTTDGTEPTIESSVYTDQIAVSTDMTIKALAAKDGMDNSAVASATYSIVTPISVAEALTATTGASVYVQGTITSITEVNLGYKNATYVISDISGGIPQNEMIIFRGKYVGGADFTSLGQIHVGDVVIVSGTIGVHNEKNQLAQGNQIETISAPAVAAPVFNPDGGGFMGETDVTITCATTGSAIYYTTDETTPSKSSTPYTAAIHINATTTIKAIAYVGDESSLVITKTFTLTAPMTVAEALEALDTEDPINNAAVAGIVCSVTSISSGHATYYISDDGTDTGDKLEVYNGYGLNGEAFADGGIQVGDQVTVFGDLTVFQSTTKEFSAGSRLLTFNRPTIPVTGVKLPATESVKKGKTITLTPTIEPANASNKNVTWSITSGSDYASVNEDGVVSGIAAGEAVIQVETEDGGFTASCTVTVAEAPDFNDPTHEWKKVTSADKLVAGKYCVLGLAGQAVTATSNLTGGYLGKVASTFTQGAIIAYDALGENTAVFQLGGEEGAWTLSEVMTQDQLLGGYGTANLAWGGENTAWPITFTEGFAVIGDANSYRILYNKQYTRFKPYNSTISKDMLLPQLFVWGLKSHMVTFDANGGVAESVPEAEPTEDGKITIPATEPTHEDVTKVFVGWYVESASDVLYKSGDEFATDEDVTFYAKWNTAPIHTVTYVLGGSGTAPEVTSYPVGKKVTIATISDLNNPGYLFSGWTVEDAEHNVLPVDENNQFVMPSSNVKVIAKWARATNDKWVLVTDVTNLKTDGTKYLIASAEEMTDGKYYAMAEQKSNNRAAVEVMHSEGIIRGSAVLADFVLEDAENGMFAIKMSDGYLYTAANNNNYLRTQTENNVNGKWTITIEDGVASIVATNSSNRKVMQFNYASNNQIFSCYGSASQKPLAIYEKAPNRVIEDETVNASDLTAGTDVTIKDGGTLAVADDDATIGDLTVEEGGVVALNNTLTVTGTFTIETTMGSGKSGELRGVNGSNFAVTGEAYIDITLGDNGNADKWHAFTVPFPVDALNGIFDLDGNKLTNEQNYAIMDYHGDIRAQGKYGWKKFRGTLVPGTFYLMTVDGLRTTYRMKMKAGSNVVADNSKYVYEYAASGEGQSTDAGWNGIGNPTLAYGQVNVAVQVLDPVNYVYVTKDAKTCNFIVGTPFFYQAAIGGEITIMGEDNEKPYYAPIRKAVKTTEQIKVSLANENYTDNLFISASEDATNNYQIGKDLVKMTMTNTPIVPQIFGVAYKTQLSMVHAPLVGDRATYTLNLYAPADGEYTISAQQTEDAIVYLTYEGSPIWNITAGEYNCDLQKGNNSGFGLMLVRRAPQVTTDIEGANQSQNGVRKLLINGQLFIEKEGKLFNVTGQRL